MQKNKKIQNKDTIKDRELDSIVNDYDHNKDFVFVLPSRVIISYIALYGARLTFGNMTLIMRT